MTFSGKMNKITKGRKEKRSGKAYSLALSAAVENSKSEAVSCCSLGSARLVVFYVRVKTNVMPKAKVT
jgi:hypothetical protein